MLLNFEPNWTPVAVFAVCAALLLGFPLLPASGQEASDSPVIEIPALQDRALLDEYSLLKYEMGKSRLLALENELRKRNLNIPGTLFQRPAFEGPKAKWLPGTFPSSPNYQYYTPGYPDRCASIRQQLADPPEETMVVRIFLMGYLRDHCSEDG